MRYQVPLFVAMQILLFPPIFRLVNPGTSAVQAPSVTQIFSSACLQEFESALLLGQHCLPVDSLIPSQPPSDTSCIPQQLFRKLYPAEEPWNRPRKAPAQLLSLSPNPRHFRTIWV